MKFKVGIIGCGVVGSALAECFENTGHVAHETYVKTFEVIRYDKFKKIGSLSEVAAKADVAFVAVPTATRKDGKQNLSALMDVLGRLQDLGFKNPVVVKSTVVPGTMDELFTFHFPQLNLVHNPEFLTEANARKDFLGQAEVLVSGPSAEAVGTVVDIYRDALPNARSRWFSDFKVTELAKYIHNTFLATKVAYMNEIYDYAKGIGCNYDLAVEAAIGQGVIGPTHCKVPGPDRKRGFGGMCFVKDTEALIASDSENQLTILRQVCDANRQLRPHAYDGSEKTGYGGE